MIGAVVFAFLGFVGLVSKWKAILLWTKQFTWRPTPGQITTSRLLTGEQVTERLAEKHRDRTGEEPVIARSGRYFPDIRYQYYVEGTLHESDRVAAFEGPCRRRAWAVSLLNRYPRGRRTSVRYDADDPSRSLLQPLMLSDELLAPAVGTGFLLVGVWWYLGLPSIQYLPLVVGGVLVLWSLFQLWGGLRSYRWPTVTGTVESTKVREGVTSATEDTAPRHYFEPRVRYTYQVDGKEYAGTRISYGGPPQYDEREEAESLLEDYALDRPVEVRYRPDRPWESVLRPGLSHGFWVPLLVGSFFAGVGAWLVL